MPAIFISHSSQDNEASADIRAHLRALGFEQVFLDFDAHDGIRAGENWEQRLYQELSRCHAVILMITRSWLASHWCHAELTIARALGKLVLPVICEPLGDARRVLPEIQATDLIDWKSDGLARIDRQLADIANDLARGFSFDPGRQPFPGFLAFERADAAIYFGRDEETRSVIEQLEQQRTRGEPSLFIVIGASGAGKSSLMKAGLLPQLGRRTRDWIVLPVMRPERTPLEALAKIVAQQLGEPSDWKKWQDRLLGEDAAQHLRELVSHLRVGPAMHATVVIPVDQFEETLSVAESRQGEAFLKALSILLDPASRLPVIVIATGRSDMLDGVLDLAGPGHDLARVMRTYALPPMPLDRVPRLIEGPAAVASLYVEPGFAAHVARHVETSEALPLLAHVLWQLYPAVGAPKRLTIAGYEALGDPVLGLNPIQNSIRRAAAEAMAAMNPSAAQMAALRDAFVPHLVSVRLEDGKRVRQPANEADLPAEAIPLLAALARARLITRRTADIGGKSAAIVEVAHEALFRTWDTLDGWLSDEYDFLSDIERLKVAAEEWRRAPEGEKDKALLHGFLLSRARAWLQEHPGRFASDRMAPIRQLIEDSAAAADIERTRRERRQRYTLYGSLGATAVFLVVAVLAVTMWVAAEKATEEARSATIRAETATAQAENNFQGAAGAISTLVEVVPRRVEPIAPFGLVQSLLDEARNAIAKLPSSTTANPRMSQYRGDIAMASADLAYELALYRQMRSQVFNAQSEYKSALEGVRDPFDRLQVEAGMARSWHLWGLAAKELEETDDDCAKIQDLDSAPPVPPEDANRPASDFYKRAVDGFDRLIENHPSDIRLTRWRVQRADVLFDLGDFYLQRALKGQSGEGTQQLINEAERVFRDGLQQLERVRAGLTEAGSAGNVTINAVEHDIGWMLNKIADIHRERGNEQATLDAYLGAEKRIGDIGNGLQVNKHWLNHLMILRNNVGLILQKRGQEQEALDRFEQAIREGGELSRRYPENMYIASNVAWSYDNAAELLLARGQARRSPDELEQARRYLDGAAAQRARFVRCKPRWQRDQAYNDAMKRAAEGYIADIRGDRAGAATHFAAGADSAWQALANDAHEDRIQRQLVRLLELRMAAARALQATESREPALAQLEKGLKDLAALPLKTRVRILEDVRDRLVALRVEIAR